MVPIDLDSFRMSLFIMVLMMTSYCGASGLATNSTDVRSPPPPPPWFTFINETIGAFIPQDSAILWNSVWVWALISRGVYMSYVSSTFFWLDVPLATVIFQAAKGLNLAYIVESQYIMAFYASLVVHWKYSLDPLISTSVFLLFTAAWMITIASLLFSAGATFSGILLPGTIGLMSGLARINLFRSIT